MEDILKAAISAERERIALAIEALQINKNIQLVNMHQLTKSYFQYYKLS